MEALRRRHDADLVEHGSGEEEEDVQDGAAAEDDDPVRPEKGWVKLHDAEDLIPTRLEIPGQSGSVQTEWENTMTIPP